MTKSEDQDARIGALEVQRFYRLYARRSSDFAAIENDYCCRTLGGAVAEQKARKLAERLMKNGCDQVRITLHVVYPIIELGFDDE